MTIKTLRQISVTAMHGEPTPPAIDAAEATAARERAKMLLRKCAAQIDKINRPVKAKGLT